METSPFNCFSFVKLLDVVSVVGVAGLLQLAGFVTTLRIISGDHMI